MKRPVPISSGLAALLLVLFGVGVAQSLEQTLTKEQQLNKLQLQESELVLEERRASLQSHQRELQVARELFDQGFLDLQRHKQTQNRYELARLRFEQAQINLEKVKLDLLKTATHLVIAEARNYRTEDGRNMVDLVIENASDTRDALLVDPGLSEAELRSLLKVENIFVSMISGPIVGEPYEIRIPTLEVGQQQQLTYRLLSQVEAVTVRLKYLDIVENKSIILTKGSQQDLPGITAAQFSQEGALNQTVNFGLTLQLLGDEERNFALAVLGLPQRITYSFVSQGARISQLRFDQNISRVQLQLRLDIPERLDPRFIGQNRTFFALVTQPREYSKINAVRTKYGDEPVPEEEVRALASNYARLELIPRGIGRLEVLVANRYQEIKVGEELHIRVEFLNRGSVAVQNIRAALDLPYDWQSTVDPTLIRILEPDQRIPVDIVARPPADSAIGQYELGIEAQGQVGTENVSSLKKNITIRLGARSNITGNAILIGILVLLVVGIGLASVKLSRR